MLLLAGVASASHAQLEYHWEDAFSPAEQERLSAWVADTHAGLELLVGPLPFTVHVYFHRRDGAREPVPWAHTQRRRGQGVHYHVDPDYPLEAFRNDWTGPHELSHLILPYLGARHAWFAEGFASFMQYQVMHAMGVLQDEQMAQRYLRNLERAERSYLYDDEPFVAAAPQLRAEGKYPTLYWGGAAYFLQLDAQLRESTGSGLLEVLRTYLGCCRRDRSALPELVDALDRAAGTHAFSEHLAEFQSRPGFPAYP